MRKIQDSDVVGKTIESIKNDSVNVLTLKFTDGTCVELWTDPAVYTGNGGYVYGIFVEEKPNG